jgi:hypothetical protein
MTFCESAHKVGGPSPFMLCAVWSLRPRGETWGVAASVSHTVSISSLPPYSSLPSSLYFSLRRTFKYLRTYPHDPKFVCYSLSHLSLIVLTSAEQPRSSKLRSRVHQSHPCQRDATNLASSPSDQYVSLSSTPTDTTFCFVSPKSAQSSPSQDPPWKKETILCYCKPWGEIVADTSCAERGSTCGMERERRRFVSVVLFVSLRTTESPAALYNHPPVSPYLSMQRRLWGRTSLSEGRRLPVNPEMVRLFLEILSDLSG